jgi:hypothetical protein
MPEYSKPRPCGPNRLPSGARALASSASLILEEDEDPDS